jgi:hypothetical protein
MMSMDEQEALWGAEDRAIASAPGSKPDGLVQVTYPQGPRNFLKHVEVHS